MSSVKRLFEMPRPAKRNRDGELPYAIIWLAGRSTFGGPTVEAVPLRSDDPAREAHRVAVEDPRIGGWFRDQHRPEKKVTPNGTVVFDYGDDSIIIVWVPRGTHEIWVGGSGDEGQDPWTFGPKPDWTREDDETAEDADGALWILVELETP